MDWEELATVGGVARYVREMQALSHGSSFVLILEASPHPLISPFPRVP